jgi:hypothetical protein
VKPVRAGRVAGWPCGQAELEGLKHARKDYPRTARCGGTEAAKPLGGGFTPQMGGLFWGSGE